MLYLVIETKGYNSKEEIPPPEQNKISVGEKFCEALKKKNNGLNIHFRTKINRESFVILFLRFKTNHKKI